MAKTNRLHRQIISDNSGNTGNVRKEISQKKYHDGIVLTLFKLISPSFNQIIIHNFSQSFKMLLQKYNPSELLFSLYNMSSLPLYYNRFLPKLLSPIIFMIKTTNIWLLLITIPFLVGVIIHFVVPLEIIMLTNPKVEEAFNSDKIQTEVKAVRALGFTNSIVTANRLQMYENVKSILVRLFELGDRYQSTNTQELKLNSAYTLANQDSLTGQYLDRSMWYIEGVSSESQMSDIDLYLVNQYSNIEPFIDALLKNEQSIYKGFESLQVTLNFMETEVYFEYPSRKSPKFKDLSAPTLSHNYNITLKNYQNFKNFQSVIIDQQNLLMCSILISDDTPIGSLCLSLLISSLQVEITGQFQNVQFQLSTSKYFILRPIYDNSVESNPEIIFDYSGNISQIRSSKFFNSDEFGMSESLFQNNNDYKEYIKRVTSSLTTYCFPIAIYTFNQQKEIVAYFVIANNFKKTVFEVETRNSQILLAMVLPSIILLVVSIIVTTFAFRHHFKVLERELNLLVEYCSLILKGDLQVELNCESEIEDLAELYLQVEELNKINKFSDPKYFQVSKPQRIIKYLEAYMFFNKYGYKTANICENIADCYMSINEGQNALRFIKKALELNLQQEKLPLYTQQELQSSKSLSKNLKSTKKSRAWRLCCLMRKYNQFLLYFKPKQEQSLQIASSHNQILQKLLFPNFNNFDFIKSLIIEGIIKIEQDKTHELQSLMHKIDDVLTQFEETYENFDEDANTFPDILRSSWYEIAANTHLQNHDYLLAYECFVNALYGHHFSPKRHEQILIKLKYLLSLYSIEHTLKQFKFISQYESRKNREFVFMVDVSNPAMTLEEIKRWKKNNRMIAEEILQKYIRETDRISINQFCITSKMVCNLVLKEDQQKVFKRELYSSFKCKQKTMYSQLIPNLKKTVNRIKNLHSQKYLIIFLKSGYGVSGLDIVKELKAMRRYCCIFIVEDKESISNREQEFYVVEEKDYEQDLERLLLQKKMNSVDHPLYVFS